MISAVLFFFGATLIYTGFLVSDRDLTTGFSVALIGLILIMKPALGALRYWRTHFAAGPRRHGAQRGQKDETRKVHLRIVKSEDDKPTIH